MSTYANSSSWTSFLKSISSFSGDLSALSAPPFILSPMSIIEFSQYWGEHQELFVDIARLNKENYQTHFKNIGKLASLEEGRMLAVLKWYLSTLNSQYASRSKSGSFEKKPLNPFLGELFVGKWSNESNQELGETSFLSEQVSHHPPINAYSLLNDKHAITVQGYSRISSTFSRTLTLSVKQYGHALIEVQGETILVTEPPLHIEGLLVASPFVELGGKSYIQSTSGLIFEIEYSGKGFFSGKKNTFKAKLYPNVTSMNQKKNVLYSVEGQWSGVSHISRNSPSNMLTLFHDVDKMKSPKMEVKPISEQHELESRKAWNDVARAIELGDMKLISQHKTKLEEQQRKLRREEKAKGIKWKRRWFKNIDLTDEANKDDPFFKLAAISNMSIKNAESGTFVGEKEDKKDIPSIHWRFDRDLWENEKEVRL